MADSPTNNLMMDARQRLALSMLQSGTDTSPVRSWTQGAARMAQALMGGAIVGRDTQDQQDAYGRMASLLTGGGDVGGSSAPGVASLPSAAPASGNAADAISGIESGGKYDLLGPVTKTGDRAYGKYQVMGQNVPSWTKDALGQEMTPQQFLSNPDAQDAVFKSKFGQYSQKYGPEGAARAWFAGEGGMNNPDAKDQLGTSVSDYSKKFMSGFAPNQVASLDPNSGPANASPAPQNPVAAALSAGGGAAPASAPTAQNPQAALRSKVAQLLSDPNPYVQRMGAQLANTLVQQQMQPPEFKTLTDITGAQRPVWVSPYDQSVKAANVAGGPGGASGAAAAGGDPEDVAKAFEKDAPGVNNRVEQLYNGEGGALNKRTNPLDGAAAQLIAIKHPDWNMTMWTAKNKMQQGLSSGQPSSLGGRLQALRNAFDHLANASDSAVEKGNVDLGISPLSYVGNKVKSMTTGQQDISNKLQREAITYGGERTKFLTGSEGSESERRAFLDSLGPDTAAPPQMAGTIEGEYTQLKSALLNQEQQVREQLGDKYLQNKPIITPEVKASLGRIEKNIELLRGKKSSPTAAAAPATGAPAAAQGGSPADNNAFQPGPGWQFSPSRQQYRDQNGNVFDLKGQPVTPGKQSDAGTFQVAGDVVPMRGVQSPAMQGTPRALPIRGQQSLQRALQNADSDEELQSIIQRLKQRGYDTSGIG